MRPPHETLTGRLVHWLTVSAWLLVLVGSGACARTTPVSGRHARDGVRWWQELVTKELISLRITDVSEEGLTRAKMNAFLTIGEVERPVELDFRFLASPDSPWVMSRYVITTTIRRSDFGLTANQRLENGEWLVGEELEITFEVDTEVTL